MLEFVGSGIDVGSVYYKVFVICVFTKFISFDGEDWMQ